MSPSVFHAAALFALFARATATCYWPTGNQTYARDLTEHMPCSNDTTSPLSTICCALNRTNPSGGDVINGRTNDECLPNGVCRNRVLNHGTMEISYWRETCTSRDWKTGLCLDVCADDWTSGNGTTGAVMTPCDGQATSLKWCCGVDTSCCNDPTKVKTLPFEFRGAIPNTASATPRAPTSTSTSSSTASPTSSGDSSSNGLSTGAKAGIGIGAAVGGLILLALGFIIARRTSPSHRPLHQHDDSVGPPVPEKVAYRHELEHSDPRMELESGPTSPEQRKYAPTYEMPS